MAITIDIDTARPYQVHVGTFLLEQAGPLVRATAGGTKAVIVTDTNVGPLYQMPVKQSLEASGYEVSICTFEAGEAHKRAETYVAILEFVAEHELSRSDVIVALGGGVVGDVAGFVAATYMRGCKFVQIPTSLLAMVDSSVGGKTAIDLAAGKNLAGAFWQPSVVIADVGCLATLTPEQFADGCGEVVKHAVIADPELFAELEKTPLTLELLNRDVARVALIIARNIDIKRAVVVADECENNQRKLLNFGHSAGHAVEACEHFELGHGNCVSIGMGIITRAAALHGVCDAALPGRIEELCARHGLKTRCELSADAVFAEALHDKKRAGDTIDLVIPLSTNSLPRASARRETHPHASPHHPVPAQGHRSRHRVQVDGASPHHLCCACQRRDARHLQHHLRRHRGHGALPYGTGCSHRDRRGRLPGPPHHEEC